jgi:hypothetical protein
MHYGEYRHLVAELFSSSSAVALDVAGLSSTHAVAAAASADSARQFHWSRRRPEFFEDLAIDGVGRAAGLCLDIHTAK